MSSTGQALGMAVGGVIGAFTPIGFALGASIGGAIGGYIDPPKGPDVVGPRLADLKQQTASYGVPIPRVYGKDAVFGNVFWIENNQIKEVATKKKTGGKGGGSKGSITEYTYYGTWALGVCLGEVEAIKRIWFNGKLFYNGVSSDVSTIVESTQREQYFTAYLGTMTQEADPRMQATLGVDGTPAYRGLCYIVFKDVPLADYGNTIVGTQVKVEVLQSASPSPVILEAAYNWTGWQTASPRLLGVVDGLIEIQEINNGGVTRRVLPGGMTVVDQVVRDLATPDLMADNLESGVWATIGNIGGATYYAKHSPSKDYHGWGSGTIAVGSLVWHSSGMELVGSRIDSGIIAARIADGLSSSWYPSAVAIDVRGFGLFVVSTDSRWYFIETDGTLIRRGTVNSPTYSSEIGGAFGPGNGQWAWLNSNRVCTFDSYTMGFVVYYATILAWNINASDVLVEDSRTPLNVGMDINERTGQATLWMDDTLIYGLVVNVAGNTIWVADLDHITEGAAANVRDIVSAECALSKVLTPSDIDVTELDRAITGYAVASVGAIRAPIEQLQAFYPFDTISDGYKIKFKPRGGASVATYDYADLIYENGQPILTRTRETDSQLPVRVSVKYTDAAREYDVSEQYAERYDGDLSNLRALDLPIVMGSDEAAGVAQALLYLYWLERYELSFVLPPSARAHQPSDVITLTTADETLSVRLVTLEDYPDGRISATARMAGQLLYTPAAVGESAPPPSSILVPNGPTMAALLDLPYLMAGMNEPGFVGAMYSPLPSWSGGVFYNSNDGGESWDAIRPVTDNATVGTATTILAAPASYLSVDAASSVTVRLNHGTLASVTLLSMFNGANHFALGVNGRWEICAAQTVVANSDGTYTLSNLMRGRYGTEQYGGSHAAGDVFVLLDQAVLQFITVPVGNIGLQKLWRAVGRDKTLESAPDIAFTYAAENLECRAPIRFRGHANSGSFDWTIEWERRSRTPVEPFSGVPTPLGETAESYVVEIWDSSYATLKRTIAGVTSESATWTYAQQIEDFGSEQTEVFARVYQISSVAGRGYALQGYLQHNVLADLLFSNVVLLMHMNGADGGTTFTDEKGKSVTVYGNAQTSTTESKFNGSSCKMDGTGDYLGLAASSDFDFGAGDFTWECWIYQVTVMTGTYADAIWCSQAGPVGFAVAIFSDGKIGITADSPAGGDWDIRKGCDPGDPRGSTAITLGTWAHIAVSRSGSNWYGFVNGAVDQTFTSSASISNAGSGYFLGHWHDGNARCFNGYIADLRITKGACRYTSAFTPPAVPFPNS